MAKFVLLLATFALFLLLTNASIYRIEIDEENPRRGCRQQMEEQQNLRGCRRFMEEKCCSGRCSCSCKGGSCSRDENTSQLFEKCCDQLEAMDEQCRCTNLKQMVEKHMMEESTSQRVKEKMYDNAEGMLKMCRMEPRSCDMGSRSVFA